LEIGGYINKLTAPNGTAYYQYTKPMVGERRSVALPVTGQIGYHTHPTGTLLFSNTITNPTGSDAEWVADSNNHLYVGALQGGDVKIGICEHSSACMRGIGRFGNEATREVQ
ncbi:hypothetical protein, partial [Alkalimonas mucilaginosa]